MRLLFAGTPEVAVPALRALLASRHEVVAVLTRPDARTGRGRRTAPSPVRVVAEDAGIEVLTPVTLRDPEVVAAIAALDVDCAPVVAYGNLVPAALLEVPRHGWVNLHFSLLPAWRGAAPVQRAIIAGDATTGASVFQLEAGLDTGPVFASVPEPIGPSDDAGALLGRLADRGAGLLVDVLDGLEDGTAVATPQAAEGVSLAPKLEVADARVDWAADAAVVDRLVRGCTPAPGAWTTFRGDRVRLGPLRLVGGMDGAAPRGVSAGSSAFGEPASRTSISGESTSGESTLGELAPGELSVTSRRVLIGAGDGPMELGIVRAAGKKPMPAADWARGVRPEVGERFE